MDDATEGGKVSDLARKFHDAYERLAPSFGYETRPDTKAFDPDSPNGRLMTAVCEEVAGKEITALRQQLAAERARLRKLLPMDCPECGPMVMIDEEGCCVTCGEYATDSREGGKDGAK